MTSSASQSRRRTAFFAAVAVVAAALGAPCRAQVAEVAAASEAVTEAPAVAQGPFADRFPNLVLKTHEGNNVRFYDDLLKGKIVLINFMYATCEER